MFGANTLLNILIAPKDAYTYHNFREWHARTKRRWRQSDVLGVDEFKVLENNRRHATQYKRKLKIMGWTVDTKTYADGRTYEKHESVYQDVVGDTYYDYFKKFHRYVLDWWGVGGKFKKTAAAVKKHRNTKSIPNSPMLDVSINFDSNSLMEKMYLYDMSYDEAISTTFKGRSLSTELITELTNFNKADGMDDEKAYNEAMKMVEIVNRNIALDKNSPTSNEYNFMINYYNKFIDRRKREMMKIQINFWFLKEVMMHHPNLSLYVLGPYNMLYRIQGIVSKRDQNVIVQMQQSGHSAKYDYEYTYSMSRDTLVNEADKGFIPANKLTKSRSKIVNSMWGRKQLRVEHRYRTENFYDLVLDGKVLNGHLPWYDAMHNCWLSPDYSNPKNLRGVDVVC